MKTITLFLFVIWLLFSFFSVYGETISQWSKILINKDYPGILPTSSFYFLKEWGRAIKKFFVFDPVKKTELELKYADEKLVETAKVVDESCGESSVCNVGALEKAFNNYLSSQERLKKRLESLSEKNQNVSELISETTEKVILHQALFDELVFLAKTRYDSVKSSIRNIKRVGSSGDEFEQVIKNFDEKLKKNKIDVIEGIGKLRMNKAELIDAIAKGSIKAVEKLPYAEGVKELKALEILTRIEEKLPEEAKTGIETAKEAIQKRLIETGEIQKAAEWKIEQGVSGKILVEGVPIETNTFEKVIEKIEEKVKEVNPVTQRPNIVNIEAVKELKIKLKSVKVVGETAEEVKEKACPTIAPDTSKGKEECLKAAKQLEEKYPGCNYAKICEDISEQKPSLDCGPAPGAPGNWRCIDGAWRDISQLPPPISSEQLATSSESVPAQKLPQPISPY